MTTVATSAIVNELKAAGEDFEWYPTTPEILSVVADDIRGYASDYRRNLRLLDIGAGDGRALTRLQDMLRHEDSWRTVSLDMFAIEKSMRHLAAMPPEVAVIGTEFREQTLVDKEVDVVFCNPPYREYVDWAYRILRECAAKRVYLVLPSRWTDVERLTELITDELDADYKTLGEFDFVNAERSARAVVSVVLVNLGYRDENAAFDAAIQAMLPELDRFDCKVEEPQADTKPVPKGRLVESGGIIDSLVAAYEEDQAKLYENYRTVVKIDRKLLAELGVTKKDILSGLRSKILGLKNCYWELLFEHLGDVTRRLTTSNRKAFLESIRSRTVIDFTGGNARAMLVWVARWAGDQFDSQLVQTFRNLSSHANAVKYKSNQKVFQQNRWKYLQGDGECTHYKLDYRLVVEGFGGISTSTFTFEARNGLGIRAYEFLDDLITVANNLGFVCTMRPDHFQWQSNKRYVFRDTDGEPLLVAKAFKNGNLHLFLAQRLAVAINVQVGRLLGWVHSAEEAAREMDLSPEDAEYAAELFAAPASLQAAPLLQLEQLPDGEEAA